MGVRQMVTGRDITERLDTNAINDAAYPETYVIGRAREGHDSRPHAGAHCEVTPASHRCTDKSQSSSMSNS